MQRAQFKVPNHRIEFFRFKVKFAKLVKGKNHTTVTFNTWLFWQIPLNFKKKKN